MTKPNDILELKYTGDRAVARLKGARATERFRLERADILTEGVARQIVSRAKKSRAPVLVSFKRASSPAKEILRAAGVSFTGPAGETFVVTPRMFVDRSRRSSAPTRDAPAATSGVSPFSKRASRVARWLLVHPASAPTISELADHVELSQAYTSQVVASLEAEDLVTAESDPNDARVRHVSVDAPGRLLDAWAAAGDRRRVRISYWDIGTALPGETQEAWLKAARKLSSARWALGGLNGAALWVRAVEPADLFVWADPTDLDRWEQTLLPSRSTRARAGLRVAWAEDPYMLNLSTIRSGLPVCDAAQLYLDCYREGERSLEQAQAIRKLMHW